jgi:hypothetical protein
MSKSIFVICDREGNPFYTDNKGSDRYKMVWAWKNKAEAESSCKRGDEHVVEFRPAKGK